MIIKHNNNRNLDSVFNEIFSSFPTNWGSDTRNESSLPPVNIFETADAYQIELLAAGRNKEDFKISMDKGILTVTVDQIKEEEERKDIRVIKKEFSKRTFKRSFSLDEKINTEAIQARYENGVLNLLLPKKEEIKKVPKQIEIL